MRQIEEIAREVAQIFGYHSLYTIADALGNALVAMQIPEERANEFIRFLAKALAEMDIERMYKDVRIKLDEEFLRRRREKVSKKYEDILREEAIQKCYHPKKYYKKKLHTKRLPFIVSEPDSRFKDPEDIKNYLFNSLNIFPKNAEKCVSLLLELKEVDSDEHRGD
jgi:hypothetical protein